MLCLENNRLFRLLHSTRLCGCPQCLPTADRSGSQLPVYARLVDLLWPLRPGFEREFPGPPEQLFAFWWCSLWSCLFLLLVELLSSFNRLNINKLERINSLSTSRRNKVMVQLVAAKALAASGEIPPAIPEPGICSAQSSVNFPTESSYVFSIPGTCEPAIVKHPIWKRSLNSLRCMDYGQPDNRCGNA